MAISGGVKSRDMSDKRWYWTFVTLDSAGRSQVDNVAVAQEFFQQSIESSLEQDSAIQTYLFELSRNSKNDRDRTLAQLCLRCFISHQIEQICIQFEHQFGEYYGFTRYDLFALVLDDEGAISYSRLAFSEQPTANSQPLTANRYTPTAIRILEKFDPDRASLATWVTRLAKQHHELNAFLLKQGLCMLSDWAILNDTKPKKLRCVLTQFHQLTQSEVEQAVDLLESYHAVYRSDRLQNNQKGICLDPTPAQLQRIGDRLQLHTPLSADAILTRLMSLATRLRQYRIAAGGGNPPSQSLDQSDSALLDQLGHESIGLVESDPQLEFLQTYRQQFLGCLKDALQRVLNHRLQILQPPKQQHFLTALKLFHCEQFSMSAIAPKIGLKAQYQVSRLLKLDDLRTDIRHWMLQCLRTSVQSTAVNYVEPDKLDKIDHQIALALEEQVDNLIGQAQASAKTPKDYISNSLLAQTLCTHLDELVAISD